MAAEGIAAAGTSYPFNPSGQLIATSSDDGTVKLWDGRTYALIATLTGHRDLVLSVAFDPQTGAIASGSADRTVRRWRTDGTSAGPLLKFSAEVVKIATLLASGTYEIPNIAADGYAVYTNNVPSGA